MSSRRELCTCAPLISMASAETVYVRRPARRSWAYCCTAAATSRAPLGRCEPHSASSTRRLRRRSPLACGSRLPGSRPCSGAPKPPARSCGRRERSTRWRRLPPRRSSGAGARRGSRRRRARTTRPMFSSSDCAASCSCAAASPRRRCAAAIAPEGEPWAGELAALARVAAEQPAAYYPASYELRRRLRRPEIAHSGRPALLVPARVLADRLFCGYGELEDPIGAAGDL